MPRWLCLARGMAGLLTFVAALFAAGIARAECWQFDASAPNSFAQGSWMPVNGKADALTTLHPSGGGWSGAIERMPVGARHVVSFDRLGSGDVPSPLVFGGGGAGSPLSAMQSVGYALFVVYAPEAGSGFTLVDFPYAARLRTSPRNVA